MQVGLTTLLLASHLAAAGPAQDCARAAAVAERRWGLPAGMLLAIGTVESGQRDPATGRILPWPWTADAAGAPYAFDTAGEAAAVVGFLRARGIASVDVGCFQVNLRAHPHAFETVSQAFDPASNADYAARLLLSLHSGGQGWGSAIARYHSPDRAEGGAYAARVMHVWSRLGDTHPAARSRSGDPHVILIDASAARIPVFTLESAPPGMRKALGLDHSSAKVRPFPHGVKRKFIL